MCSSWRWFWPSARSRARGRWPHRSNGAWLGSPARSMEPHKARCLSASKTMRRTRPSCRSRPRSNGRMTSARCCTGSSTRRGKRRAASRKMHALRRIVRRVGEPLIIFTEYRDTLDAIRDAIGGLRRITTLHGGQTAHERRAVGARVHERRRRRDDRHRCGLGRA